MLQRGSSRFFCIPGETSFNAAQEMECSSRTRRLVRGHPWPSSTWSLEGWSACKSWPLEVRRIRCPSSLEAASAVLGPEESSATAALKRAREQEVTSFLFDPDARLVASRDSVALPPWRIPMVPAQKDVQVLPKQAQIRARSWRRDVTCHASSAAAGTSMHFTTHLPSPWFFGSGGLHCCARSRASGSTFSTGCSFCVDVDGLAELLVEVPSDKDDAHGRGLCDALSSRAEGQLPVLSLCAMRR